MSYLDCPVCLRQVSSIERWRGLYVCNPCIKKYEKIEFLIQNGQVLNSVAMRNIVQMFGKEELEAIKSSVKVKIQ
jgi:hypothetical protein